MGALWKQALDRGVAKREVAQLLLPHPTLYHLGGTEALVVTMALLGPNLGAKPTSITNDLMTRRPELRATLRLAPKTVCTKRRRQPSAVLQ